jgi:hypothetical protein
MKNGRCRMHGGLSTGPRTAEGLARSRRARWKHGFDSAEIRALRRETMLTARRLAGLVRLTNANFPRAEFPLRSPRRRRRASLSASSGAGLVQGRRYRPRLHGRSHGFQFFRRALDEAKWGSPKVKKDKDGVREQIWIGKPFR